MQISHHSFGQGIHFIAPHFPDLPILVCFVFLIFSVLRFFWCPSALFSKDFKISAERKILVFFGGSSFFCKKGRIGGSGFLMLQSFGIELKCNAYYCRGIWGHALWPAILRVAVTWRPQFCDCGLRVCYSGCSSRRPCYSATAPSKCHSPNRSLCAIRLRFGCWLAAATNIPVCFMDAEEAVFQSRFLGRGCDEALFSEKKGSSVKRGEVIQ